MASHYEAEVEAEAAVDEESSVAVVASHHEAEVDEESLVGPVASPLETSSARIS